MHFWYEQGKNSTYSIKLDKKIFNLKKRMIKKKFAGLQQTMLIEIIDSQFKFYSELYQAKSEVT